MGPNAAGRRRHLLAVLVVTALAAACSGGDDAAPTTTLPVTAAPTTPAPTTVPSTTLPPTTTPPPTTPPPTTAPVTTSPATSVDPASAEALLPQLITDYIAASNDVFRDPANETLRSRLAELATGPALDQIITSADDYVLASTFARPDPANPSRVEPIPVTFGSAPNGDPVVTMDGCVIDTDQQVTIGDDGTEQVGDTTPDSFLMSFTATLSERRWVVSDLVIEQRFEDQVGCA